MKEKLTTIPPSAKKVIDIVSTVTGVDVSKKSRKKSVVTGRAIVYKILRDKEAMPLTKIGALFEKDHATVCHGLRGINTYMKFEKDLSNTYKKCLDMYVNNEDVGEFIENEKLAKKIFDLEMENLDLNAYISDLKGQLSKLKEKNKGQEEFLEMIRIMVPPKKKEVALKKIRAVLNGI